MTADPPPTRAEIEGDIEFYLGHGDEGVRDLAVTALALLSENKRLTSLAKHERDNRGEQTKNKRVTHDVLTGMLRTAEARIKELERVVDAARKNRRAEVGHPAVLGDTENGVYCQCKSFREHYVEIQNDGRRLAETTREFDAALALLSEPQEGEGADDAR